MRANMVCRLPRGTTLQLQLHQVDSKTRVCLRHIIIFVQKIGVIRAFLLEFCPLKIKQMDKIGQDQPRIPFLLLP